MSFSSEFSVNAIKENVRGYEINTLDLLTKLRRYYTGFDIETQYPNQATSTSGYGFNFLYNNSIYYVDITYNNYTNTFWFVLNDGNNDLVVQRNIPNADCENLLFGYLSNIGLAYKTEANTFYLYTFTSIDKEAV